MLDHKLFKTFASQPRTIEVAEAGDKALGPLRNLPGVWRNLPSLPGRGWNMIALPFSEGKFGYRLLLNQYNEELKFTTVDKSVANRGIPNNTSRASSDGDQFLAVLDYEQTIQQIASEDSPNSGKAGDEGLTIHHEPGLWIHMLNEVTNNLDIARLATIPHGDSVLALGSAAVEQESAPNIEDINGLPIGVTQDLDSKYLEPYKQFHENLFMGLFDPVHPNALLNDANNGVEIVRTTKLEVDTSVEDAGISNIPFIVKQANATEMKSTFWLQELAEKDNEGNPKLRLQYSQTVFLDFFPRKDGVPGLIRWPHVSINTLEKVDVSDDVVQK